jgi:hypothetical protein
MINFGLICGSNRERLDETQLSNMWLDNQVQNLTMQQQYL